MAPLFPQLGPNETLVGIARLAAAGEVLKEGHNVEYFSIENRSVLCRCTSKRMPFRWTINPYRAAASLAANTVMRATPTSSWRCATEQTLSAKFT
ncbi:MAG TPA: hypothetical protein VKT33_13500 [Candidatus Angelobacter sp.]|nr:hypothetical protein [Candidatus Angelobacter sp.]